MEAIHLSHDSRLVRFIRFFERGAQLSDSCRLFKSLARIAVLLALATFAACASLALCAVALYTNVLSFFPAVPAHSFAPNLVQAGDFLMIFMASCGVVFYFGVVVPLRPTRYRDEKPDGPMMRLVQAWKKRFCVPVVVDYPTPPKHF